MTTIALGLGLLLNQFRDAPLPLLYQSKQVRFEQEVARLVPLETPRHSVVASSAVREVGLEEFREFVSGRRGLVLDARPEIFHRLGHVPGALSLPRDDFEKAYARQRSKLEGNKDLPVAVSCSDAHCEDGRMVAEALQRLGFRHVLLFKGGWAEWTRAGLPEERS
ncbi:MAG: rhodanese-like domain-containing protein [Verrucomicrobiae bacterium]|nr:rhodanese-like domain-containing protein [Verrucomicrobiae bacterium]